MALTAEGRELTEIHRLGQVALAAEHAVVVQDFVSLIDLADIDGSVARWFAAMESTTVNGHRLSQEMSENYLRSFTLAEIGEGTEFVRPLFPQAQLVEDLRVAGPVRMKTLIGQGVDPEQALQVAMSESVRRSMTAVLAGGRDLIDKSVRYRGRSGRYRRVTGGQACAFCAMLASRGPVYSEKTAYFRSHHVCGCSAEPVFGEWEPNEREALWRASYRQAALDADEIGLVRTIPAPHSAAEDNILWRMRRNAPHLFTDGVQP